MLNLGTRKIQQLENCHTVSIPKIAIDNLNLKKGDKIEFWIDGNKLILNKKSDRTCIEEE